MAPDFDLPVLVGGVRKQFRLSEHWSQRNLVLAFYPANWEPVSARQMVDVPGGAGKASGPAGGSARHQRGSIMNTTAWEREIGPFDFLLGSDFWPHGEVSREYGVLREADPFREPVSAPFS